MSDIQPTQEQRELAERILDADEVFTGHHSKALEDVATLIAEYDAKQMEVLRQLWKKIHGESNGVICMNPTCELCAAAKQLNTLLK